MSATSSELRDAVAAVKSAATAYSTNLYATPEELDGWAERDELTVDARPGVVFALRRDQDFHHLYYAAPSPEALEAALTDPAAPWRAGTVTVDLIGRPRRLEPTVELFGRAGFAVHDSLMRMSRTPDPDQPDDYVDDDVEHATPADAPAVQAFLARLLDRFTEQVPTERELREAAEAGGLLLVRRGDGDLGGVLFFETTGLSSVLRYWFVNDRFRNQGIGGRLIKTFFRLCRDSRRITLWVIADNADSIAKYEHYRFRPEGLVDRILIRRGDSA